jgi:hypothetical protein
MTIIQNRRDFITTTLAAIGAAALCPGVSSAAPRSILILGGTGFVGPHQVRRAIERGHQVTIFNRGRSAPGMFGKDVEELAGDRANNLEALKGRKWDAVIDESASGSDAPEWVRQSATILRDATDQYLFISQVTARAQGREGAAATSDSRPRGARSFRRPPNGVRPVHPRPTAPRVSRRRRAEARSYWLAPASRRARAPSVRE